MKNSKRFDAVFYDLDGTLIDSVPVITLCFRKAYEELFGSCTRTDEDLQSYIGKPLTETFAMHGEEDCRRLTDTYLRINREYLEKDLIPLFDNVYEDLSYLRSLGIRQGLVTSKKRVSAEVTVKYKGLDRIFDCFVYCEDTERHKPYGDPIVKAANDLGITDMSRVLYVGDALPDLLSARDAGAAFALVEWTRLPVGGAGRPGGYEVLKRLKDISCII
ncbi:MAG: HAD-IA family hydrolase [Clostridiales bacterium]|nr:HAD-IA family hydrolase [Clostridiales bacterium]